MLVVKDLPANAGDARDMGSIPGLIRSPGRGNGNPFQYSCQDNLIDRGWTPDHGVAKSQTRLSMNMQYSLGPSMLLQMAMFCSFS